MKFGHCLNIANYYLYDNVFITKHITQSKISQIMNKGVIFSSIIILLLNLSACNKISSNSQSDNNANAATPSHQNQQSQPINTYVNDSANTNISTSEMNLPNFNEIEISCASEIIYSTEGNPSIKIISDKEIASNININTHDKKLTISLNGNNRYDCLKFEIHGTSKLEEIDLTGACSFKNNGILDPRSLDIDCTGASTIALDNISTKELNIDCLGASSVSISNINCSNLGIDCEGASSVKASGRCNNAEFEAMGASVIDVSNLKASKITKEEIVDASTLKK